MYVCKLSGFWMERMQVIVAMMARFQLEKLAKDMTMDFL